MILIILSNRSRNQAYYLLLTTKKYLPMWVLFFGKNKKQLDSAISKSRILFSRTIYIAGQVSHEHFNSPKRLLLLMNKKYGRLW